MNVGRGLFRAWVMISILWIVGAGGFAYLIILPDMVSGGFEPVVDVKTGTTPGMMEEIGRTIPFYDLAVSPATEKLTIRFYPSRRRLEQSTQFGRFS
jgi:hypothetical protein